MLQVDGLMLEVTRRCNLKCGHCLRGNAQQLKMSPQVIYHTLKNIEHASSLTFTGGEPSLACDVLEDLYRQILMFNFTFDSFYVVTNGKNTRNRKRFLNILYKFYQLAQEPEQCSLVVSQDQFHRYERGPANLKYLDGMYVEEFGEEYYRDHPFFKPNERKDYIYQVLREGRAKNWGKGYTPKQTPWFYSDYCIYDYDSDIYISANGNVVSNCNMSFLRIDQEAKGNIIKEPLISIVERFCQTSEELETA